MTSRKDLKREYKEKPHIPGIFQIKNLKNGKVLLGSSLNIDGPLNAHEFMLSSGSHRNRDLQLDYKILGAKAFSFYVLAVIELSNKPGFNVEDELQLLEQLWLDELKPFGENGYNLNDKIRHA